MEKMESIQQQISLLTRKIDRVYQILDRIDRDAWHHAESPAANGFDTIGDRGNDSLRVSAKEFQPATDLNGHRDPPHDRDRRHDTTDWVIAQQDVLIDSSGVEIGHHQIKEQDLSPQIQIQRLTAQLTAAYNRIAALEEQLLAKRWK